MPSRVRIRLGDITVPALLKSAHEVNVYDTTKTIRREKKEYHVTQTIRYVQFYIPSSLSHKKYFLMIPLDEEEFMKLKESGIIQDEGSS